MSYVEIIGSLAGICTTVAVIPQIIKAFRTKEVDDVSPFFFVILLVGVGLWTYYGFLKNDWPLIVTNGVSFLLNGTMLALFFVKRQKNNYGA